jgi:uncharacterized protein YbjT (DUF2867 family)
MAALHVSIEQALHDAGVDVTILRPGMFASNAVRWWAPQMRTGDVIRWPFAEAASAPVDDRDITAVAALALLGGQLATGDYVLTGPASLTHAEQVATIGNVLGRSLQYEELSPEAFRHAMATAPAAAEMLLNAWRAATGLPAYVTSSVEDITGRPPRTFREWVADHASLFR